MILIILIAQDSRTFPEMQDKFQENGGIQDLLRHPFAISQEITFEERKYES